MEDNRLKLVVIISDGIRGHLNQSKGVALWLSRLAGAEVLEFGIPKLKGIRRWTARRRAAELAAGGRETALGWLKFAGGEDMAKLFAQRLIERDMQDFPPNGAIFMSAGSMPAFYCLALGRIFNCPCATIMTPSVTGTEPFDFAIVPGHDYPREARNVMITLGAPNLVVKEELSSLGESMLRGYPPKHGLRWGLLIGGDDKNYKVTAKWIRTIAGEIFREAERRGADLYITTSRRTSHEAEEELKRIAAERCENVRFLLIASADPSNPVPAMLGACDEIFVTDDSVNMVSEAATAGHRAVLLRAERTGALKKILQAAARKLVSSGLLPARALWGAPRFDVVFESFKGMGLLVEFQDWIQERRNDAAPLSNQSYDRECGFNEARRAAEWILDSLGGL